MTGLLPFLALLLVTVAWAALPLVPALREFFRPTDIDPLTMVGRDNADISRFARHFREYAQANLERLPGDTSGGDHAGRLPDGTPFLRTRIALAPPSGWEEDRLVVLESAATLAGGQAFRLELWARGELTGGPGATYRAVLGERTVRLGPGSTVLRWAHAADWLAADDGAALYGRTSSDRGVRLGRGVRFERIGAPVITVGHGTAPSSLPVPPDPVPFRPPPESRRLGDHLRIEADWFLAPHSGVEGNLVVAGRLHIGAGVRVRGSVKAHGRIDVDPGAVVEGSLVSREGIRIGEGCAVAGPIIAEDDVEISPNATVGLSNRLTTVSARRLLLGSGAVICGHLVTAEGGQTAS